MNAAKTKKKTGSSRKTPKTLTPFQRLWRRSMIVLAFVALAVGGSLFAWQRLGDKITQAPDYLVKADSIVITTPTPNWIRTDVRAEVVRDGSLEGLSILDRQLTVKVAQAFAMHSWVQAVKHVSKHPQGRVMVDLEYRQPVAMVEVVVDGQPGLLPVDGQGVLLSPVDFTAEDVSEYIRIAVPDSRPVGTLGEAWGDLRVHGAACLAAVLHKRWKQLGLCRIAVTEGDSAGGLGQTAQFELQTRAGARVLWGAAPDPGDPTQVQLAAAKAQRLIERVETLGPLDEMAGNPAIDLRLPQEITPETAQTSSQERWE